MTADQLAAALRDTLLYDSNSRQWRRLSLVPHTDGTGCWYPITYRDAIRHLKDHPNYQPRTVQDALKILRAEGRTFGTGKANCRLQPLT